jgi:hypothetical protein
VTLHDEKDKGADHMDWDPGFQAMLSLPHLPCMHSLGFLCTARESTHVLQGVAFPLGILVPPSCHDCLLQALTDKVAAHSFPRMPQDAIITGSCGLQ